MNGLPDDQVVAALSNDELDSLIDIFSKLEARSHNLGQHDFSELVLKSIDSLRVLRNKRNQNNAMEEILQHFEDVYLAPSITREQEIKAIRDAYDELSWLGLVD